MLLALATRSGPVADAAVTDLYHFASRLNTYACGDRIIHPHTFVRQCSFFFFLLFFFFFFKLFDVFSLLTETLGTVNLGQGGDHGTPRLYCTVSAKWISKGSTLRSVTEPGNQ